MGTRYSERLDTLDAEDELSRDAIVKMVATRACQPRDSGSDSHVIGVFGNWGAGKTRILKLVGASILRDSHGVKRFRVMVFPAWQYEHGGDLGTAFIRALWEPASYPPDNLRGEMQEVESSLAVPWKKVQEAGRALIEILGAIASSSLIPGAWGVAAMATQAVATTGDKLKLAQAAPQVGFHKIRSAVNDVVETVLNETHERLIVLVDDLDRCAPDAMVRMFEWMKLHFTHGRCTFVVALDHKAAAHAIVGRYKDYLSDRGDTAFGYRYLDKLFDDDFEIRSSRLVQQMAVRRSLASHEDSDSETFADLSRAILGYDFPWRMKLDELVNLRCLGDARTMLKISDAYVDVLSALRTALTQGNQTRLQDVPREAPYWLLLLTCMKYTLKPSVLDNFVHHDGPIFRSYRSGGLDADLLKLSAEHPAREFAIYLAASVTPQINRVPTKKALVTLLSLVRQRVVSDSVRE